MASKSIEVEIGRATSRDFKPLFTPASYCLLQSVTVYSSQLLFTPVSYCLLQSVTVYSSQLLYDQPHLTALCANLADDRGVGRNNSQLLQGGVGFLGGNGQ